jgi:hypothetical protein
MLTQDTPSNVKDLLEYLKPYKPERYESDTQSFFILKKNYHGHFILKMNGYTIHINEKRIECPDCTFVNNLSLSLNDKKIISDYIHKTNRLCKGELNDTRV